MSVRNIQLIEKACSELDPSTPALTDFSSITQTKMYFETVMLGAIKIIITIKIEKQAFEISLDDPKGGFGVFGLLSTVFSSIANISDSPLRFKELAFMHIFSS